MKQKVFVYTEAFVSQRQRSIHSAALVYNEMFYYRETFILEVAAGCRGRPVFTPLDIELI